MLHFLDFLEQTYQGQEPVLKDARQAYIRYIRQQFDDSVAMDWIVQHPPETLRDIVQQTYVTHGGSDCNPLYESICIDQKITAMKHKPDS